MSRDIFHIILLESVPQGSSAEVLDLYRVYWVNDGDLVKEP